MDIASIINGYTIPVIVGICLAVGFIIKHSLSIIPNKYIPAIMGGLGLVLNIVVNINSITLEVILAGLVSGLASTGIHSGVKSLSDKTKNTDN